MSIDLRLEERENLDNIKAIERIEQALLQFQEFLGNMDLSTPDALGNMIAHRANEFEILVNELSDSIQIFNGLYGDLLEQLINQNTTEINNPFYRIRGLVDHDIKKTFVLYMGYLGMLQYIMIDGVIAPNEYDFLWKSMVTVNSVISESLNMLELLKQYRSNVSSVDIEILPSALGFKNNGDGTYTYETSEGSTTTVRLNQNLLIETPETLFTISTLLLNAKGERAENVTLDVKEDQDTLVITLLDNATNGEFPEEFIRDVQASFKSGMQNPYKPLPGSSGGGKLAAFLAGQRYALENPLAKINYYEDPFTIVEGEAGGLKAKGFKITINKEGMLMPLSLKALNYEFTHIDYIAKLLREENLVDKMEFVSNYLYSFKNNLQNHDSFLNLLLLSYPENKILNNISPIIYQKFEELLNPLIEQIMKGMRLQEVSLNKFINFVKKLIDFSTNPGPDNWGKLNEYLEIEDQMGGAA